jgi:hypothetical protein
MISKNPKVLIVYYFLLKVFYLIYMRVCLVDFGGGGGGNYRLS